MTPPLPKALELVQSSVNDGIKHQKPLFQLNLVAFIAPLILAVLTSEPVLAQITAMRSPALSIAATVGFFVGVIVAFVAVCWFSVYYLLRVLKLLKGDETPVPTEAGNKLTPGYVWISVLQFVAVAVIPFVSFVIAFFLGLGEQLSNALSFSETEAPSLSLAAGLGILALFVVSIVSVIFLSIRLQFSGLSLVQDGKRGVAALKHAWSLTKGRFWSIFWRGLVFVILYQIAAMLVGGIVGTLNGTPAGTYVAMVITHAFNGFLLFPIAMFFQVRLYQAYRHEGVAITKSE